MKTKREIVTQLVLVTMIPIILLTYPTRTREQYNGLLSILYRLVPKHKISKFFFGFRERGLSVEEVSFNLECAPVFQYVLKNTPSIGNRSCNALNALADELKNRGDSRTKEKIIKSIKPSLAGLPSIYKQDKYKGSLGLSEKVAMYAVEYPELIYNLDDMSSINESAITLLSWLNSFDSLDDLVNAVSLRELKQIAKEWDKYYSYSQCIESRELGDKNGTEIALLLRKHIVNIRKKALFWVLSDNNTDWWDIAV